MSKSLLVGLTVAASVVAQAGNMDRPTGIKIGERLTLRPYVSLSYTFDSNVDQGRHSSKKAGSSWSIAPKLGFDYKGENWNVAGSAFYQYHAYANYPHKLNNGSWGENMSIDWTTEDAEGRGWAFRLSEDIHRYSQDDDMTETHGRGIWRDRINLTGNAAIERRFTERLHAALTGSIYWLDYDNDENAYAPLYGWSRWTAGANVGYMISPKSDVYIAGNYQGYLQDNHKRRSYGGSGDEKTGNVANQSKGVSVHVGVQTRATERFSYNVSAGWSRFEYAEGLSSNDGFTYSAAGQWKLSDTLNLMGSASSYYQPSEREYGAALKCYTASVGLGKSFVRGKLSATADLSWRLEDHVYATYRDDDYNENIWALRLGLNYTLNKYLGFFGSAEYQTEQSSGSDATRNNAYDFERWRLSLGVNITY